MKSILTQIKEYLLNVLDAVIWSHPKRWQVFYIGETGVRQLSFGVNDFNPMPAIAMRAELQTDRDKGVLNDIYLQMKIDEENLIAIYCKDLSNK